jgi:hypothetical protein
MSKNTMQSMNNIDWTLASILFKLSTVFVYILKMCTSYYGLIWRFCSYIFCMPNLVIFYHYMSWMVPSWCNLKLQQCSINIIQSLHSVCIHIEDVHLLLWADLTNVFVHFPRTKWLNYNYIFHMDKINMYIHTAKFE